MNWFLYIILLRISIKWTRPIHHQTKKGGKPMGYIEDLRKIVGHRPLILVGSVVIIIDEQGKLLLQQRTFPNGVWGIPGGLMELGESTEDVARREIFEETGLHIGQLHLI